MAKYIPGTTIHYGARKGGVYFHPDSEEPIGFSLSLADAGYVPDRGGIELGRNAVHAPLYAAIIDWRTKQPTGEYRRDGYANACPHDPRLEVWDMNGKHVRRYSCRAQLDMIESEILTGDRKGLGMAKLNRAGRKAWGRARTDAHNATLLEMWRSRHPEAVAS